jgi:hypothetical protein
VEAILWQQELTLSVGDMLGPDGEWRAADDLGCSIAHLHHVLDREIARTRQLVADAESGNFQCPPQLAGDLARATNEFVAEVCGLWLRAMGLDRADGFADRDLSPEMRTFDALVARIVEWSQNSATAFAIAGGLEPGSVDLEPGSPDIPGGQ